MNGDNVKNSKQVLSDSDLILAARGAFFIRWASVGIPTLDNGGETLSLIRPGALAAWRDESRASFQRRPVEAVRRDREAAEVAIAAAPRVSLGGIEVADAAAIAANAMALFGIEGSGAAHAMDMIAGFANATTGSVSDFKFSLAASGAAAKLAGQSFDDTAVAIALLGKAGILGSDAGTSLKTMLLNLQPTTKTQIEAFKEL